MEHRCKLFTTSQSSSSKMASKGTKLTAISGLTMKGEPWIIDSRASDHMTGCEKSFSKYDPNPSNHKVKIADGSFTVVASVGTIELIPQITLTGVLYVPHLSCNVCQLAKLLKT